MLRMALLTVLFASATLAGGTQEDCMASCGSRVQNCFATCRDDAKCTSRCQNQTLNCSSKCQNKGFDKSVERAADREMTKPARKGQSLPGQRR